MLRHLYAPSCEYERLAVILGCQKSGASTLLNMFEYDRRVEVFGEDTAITGDGKDRLRLRPVPEVLDILKRADAPLVLIEPKVESHRAAELLNTLPRSRVLWMLRDYRIWLDAYLGRWTGQSQYLRIFLEHPNDWRGEGASEQTRDFVRRFYTPGLSRADCSALIWYTRNILFFEQGLDFDERVFVVKYESLVKEANDTLAQIYGFLGIAPSVGKAAKVVRGRTIGRPSTITLDPDIEDQCAALLEKFNECCHPRAM